jgi:hypothetical protein
MICIFSLFLKCVHIRHYICHRLATLNGAVGSVHYSFGIKVYPPHNERVVDFKICFNCANLRQQDEDLAVSSVAF